LTEQTANARNRAVVRIVIGVLIAMLAIYSATNLQPSNDAATLASRVFAILIAVLSLYLIASGIKSVPSSGACSFGHSDTVDKVHAEGELTQKNQTDPLPKRGPAQP
jgi:hypothetical protein